MQRHMAVIILWVIQKSLNQNRFFLETNIIENFYYGNNYTQGDDEYTGFEPCVYSCSSDMLQMEYQVITRIQRFEKKGKQVSSYNSRVNICLY